MNVQGVSAAIVVGLSLLGASLPAHSLGFGRSTSRAILGETLSVSVPVRLDAGDELADNCVAADVYFGDDKLSASAVAASVLPGSGAERTVRVVTTALINEPVVTVYLAAGCKAKITRKFVAFADPPGMVGLGGAGASSSGATSSAVAPPQVESGVLYSTAVSSAAPESSTAATGKRAKQAKRAKAASQVLEEGPADAAPAVDGQGKASAGSPVAAGKSLTGGRDATGGKPAKSLSAKLDERPAAKPAQGGARLELDPASADALVAPNLTMSAGLSGLAVDPQAPGVAERRAAAAALWAAMNASPEQLARGRQRVHELEQRLAALQQDAAAAQARVASMEARVRAAEGGRFNHPLVYGLAGACLLLAGAVAWLFMRQRREEEAQASWWQQGGEPTSADAEDETTPAATMAEPALARTSAEFMPRTAAPEPVAPAAAPSWTDGGPPASAPALSPVASAVASAVGGAPAFSPAADNTVITRPVLIKSEAQEAVREITVEELIDLEQQAEFFVVLGQDEAAIELLEGHVQTAGASPLPYLKLLEIYQRLGQREHYERTRASFNERFNAYAPAWESDLQHGHSLEDYPGVVERLQSLWSQPAKAMEVLQVSLTRADGSEETFDLPAYRELLFLYAVARDLSERESADRTPVDLLLPVSDPRDVDGSVDVPSLQPLMATRPVKALPEASPSLSLDLSLDDPVPPASSGHGAFVDDGAGRPVHGNGIEFEPVHVPGGRKS